MADSSVGTLPSCSLSGVAAPGSRSTSANSRWSQRKGSLVSSLPAKGEFRGRCSYTERERKKKEEMEVEVLLRFTNSISIGGTLHSTTSAFVYVLTSSGTPELCVSLFPSVMVMITDGSRKKGLQPWGRNGNIQQLITSSDKQRPHSFSLIHFPCLYVPHHKHTALVSVFKNILIS